MSIRENMAIPVLNYNNQYVYAVSNITTYEFAPSKDNVPTVCYISFPEIVYINSISDCFRTGLLEFPDDIKEEAYREIKFAGWKDIISNAEIRDILTSPTKEGIEKIIAITNQSVFGRVKSILVELKNSNSDDVSNRIIKIVDARWLEIKRGIFKSQIQVNFKGTETEKTVDNSEIENVKAQNIALQEQLAEMQKMIEQLANKEVGKTESVSTETVKKAGRPPKKK